MRIHSRSNNGDAEESSPFDEVFRRQKQAEDRLETAVESEDYQAIGMHLRECLLSLAATIRRKVQLSSETQRPQDANFISWIDLLCEQICPGSGNKQLRHFLKNMGRETWQLVNWLTHDRDANRSAASIAIDTCEALVMHFLKILVRDQTDHTDECPLCKSRNIRTHYDHRIEPDGAYYMTCGRCDWSTHPGTSI